jgi:Ca-activated chloride channel family protein
MVVLDVSASMLATDVAPNRFERTKVILTELIGRLQGDRVGLTVFAGNAALRFPLTVDMAAARELVRSAAIREGSLQAGTGVGDGIRVAATSFPAEDQTRSKVILLVTDGEDLAGSPLDAVKAARDRNIVIHTMGIDPTTGQPAISKRDEGILRQIASSGKGRYFDGNADDPAAAVADEIGRLARTKFESQEGTLPIERFQWFVAAGLLLLVVDFLLPDSRGRRRLLWPGVRRQERARRPAGRGGEAA